MLNPELCRAYRAQRTLYGSGRAWPVKASDALARARALLARGETRTGRNVFTASMGATFQHCGRTCRTIEGDATALGFVHVVNAEDAASIDHNGWYSRADDYDSLYRGIVLTLRTRDGWRVYAGYVESDSDCIILDMDAADTLPRGSDDIDTHRGHDLRDAALAADSFAERAAEQSREYDAAWQAGTAYADALETVRSERAELRGLIQGLRACVIGSNAVCAALRSQIRSIRASVRESLESARRLRNGEGATDSDHWQQFYTGSADLCAAFNDGAGAAVLPVTRNVGTGVRA